MALQSFFNDSISVSASVSEALYSWRVFPKSNNLAPPSIKEGSAKSLFEI